MTTRTANDSPLIQHAEAEMLRAGLYDDDADYGGMVPDAVMNVVRAFAGDGHSGSSAALVTSILESLLRFEPLTPLTSDPDEWMNVSEISGAEMWQSRRNPTFFSEDGGASWYTIEPSQATFGDRVRDGGKMGTLVRCHECGGSGQLHQLDEQPLSVETDHE